MKNNSSIRYSVLILAFVTLLPFSASAATVYLESSRATISVGDTVVLTAKINADGVTINAVEGDIAMESGGNVVAVQEFCLANSAFGLWPRTPSLSNDGTVISFVGGVPGGFNIEGATVFKIILQAKKEGVVTIAPQNIVVYASDGKGTKLPVQIKKITLNVEAKKGGVAPVDEWNGIVSGDVVPPEDFIVVLGQDATLFGGKKFAFFSALDNQSGISYYEVSENNKPAIRSGSTYVLQDQVGATKLNVIAYDKAGNKKVAIYPSSTETRKNISWLIVGIIICVIVIGWILFRKIRKSKKDAPILQ